MHNSVNKSAWHKIINVVGGVSEYKTCLRPDYLKSLSFKFKSKTPQERMSAYLKPDSMKYQFP